MEPDHIIWLSGMPRSGTSWVAQILASHPSVRLKYDPLFSYEFKNALDDTAGADDWAALFADVYARESPYLDQEFLRVDGHVPSFERRDRYPPVLAIKSNRHHDLIAHAVRIGVTMKVLHLVRDPVDTIASWLANKNEFPESASAIDEWRTGTCRKTAPGEYWGFDDWKKVTEEANALAATHPDRFRVTSYDAFVADPVTCATGMFAWIGLDLSGQTRRFLEDSRTRHSDHPRAVFRDPRKRKDHRAALPEGTEATIRTELAGTGLASFLRQCEGVNSE